MHYVMFFSISERSKNSLQWNESKLSTYFVMFLTTFLLSDDYITN